MALEQHRTFPHCIFCGSTEERKKEHLFGKTFAKKMKVARASLYSYIGTPGGENHQRDRYTVLARTSRLLCYTCNTDRLGPTMQDATGIVLGLATGRILSLSKEDRQRLLKYFQRIGYIVDVLNSNHELTEEQRQRPEHREVAYYRNNPPIYDARQRYLWLSNALGPETATRWPMPIEAAPAAAPLFPFRGSPHVFIGRHRGNLGAELPINNSKHFAPAVDDFGKRFQYVVGELAISITWGLPLGEGTFPATHSIPDCYIDLSIDEESINWPPARPVTYSDFWLLHNPPVPNGVDYHALAEQMHDPQRRAAIIAEREHLLGLVPGSTRDE